MASVVPIGQLVGVGDESIAEKILDPTSDTSAAIASVAARSSFVRDIRDFLVGSEVLDPTGAQSVSVTLQRAFDALTAEYAAQSGWLGKKVGYQVQFPEGLFRTTVRITQRTGVGICAAGLSRTVFLPQGNQSFIHHTPGAAGYSYDDVNYSDFTVEGAGQTNGSYTTGIKGFFIQFMKRARFERVRVRNTWATGFGVDHLQDTVFVDCIAENCGRGVIEKGIDPQATSGASGFGIGTGGYELESCTIINCLAKGNALHGFFTEKQTAVPYYSMGFKMVSCYAEGNWIGFRDCGSKGAIIEGNHFVNNTYCGVSIDKTILALNAGREGIVSGNVITGNGSNPGSDRQGAGIVIGAADLGGYTIRGNEIHDNIGHGIHAPSTAVFGGRFLIDKNHVYRNTVDGVRFDGASAKAHLTGNTTHDNGGQGVRFAGSKTSPDVKLTDNDCEDGLLIEHTMSGRYINERNIVSYAAPSALAVTGFSSTTLTLSWTAPANVTGLTDYVVQYRTSPAGAWTAFAHTASTNRTLTVTGLTTGTAYDFRVAAVANGNTSAFSGTTTGTPTAAPKYVDHFSRADGTLDGSTAPDGPETAVWSLATDVSGVMGVGSGYAKAISGNGNAFALLTAGADGKVQATASFLSATLTGRRASLIFRFQDVSNYWRVSANPSGGTNEWRLSKIVGGTATVLGTAPAVAVSGDVVAAEFSGSTVRWWVNGVLIGTVTDAALQTATKVGLHGAWNSTGGTAQDQQSKWDDFTYFSS